MKKIFILIFYFFIFSSSNSQDCSDEFIERFVTNYKIFDGIQKKFAKKNLQKYLDENNLTDLKIDSFDFLVKAEIDMKNYSEDYYREIKYNSSNFFCYLNPSILYCDEIYVYYKHELFGKMFKYCKQIELSKYDKYKNYLRNVEYGTPFFSTTRTGYPLCFRIVSDKIEILVWDKLSPFNYSVYPFKYFIENVIVNDGDGVGSLYKGKKSNFFYRIKARKIYCMKKK